MIGVKITILLFVISVISTVLTRSRASTEDIETRLKMLTGIYPTYVKVTSVLILITIVGIIYSTIYLLFFM